ncbi:MAG: heavy metal-binding domain-containing protein [Armatimonadota bacterium]
MKRWITPIVAILAVGLVAVVIAGCQTEQADTEAAVTQPTDTAVAIDEHAAAHDVEGEFTYTCPMHPDVQQNRPGNCPECGMFLVADTDEAVEYYCPMHEDVVEEHPGKCPECGMFLEARPADDAE